MSLQQATAIVTGASSGMGRATAVLAGREGANVICLDKADPGSTAEAIEGAGGVAVPLTGDISDRATWLAATALALDRFGQIDALANVAGIVAPRGSDSVLAQDDDTWHLLLDVNLKGTWLGMQAVLPAMIERGTGAIVNFASVTALRGHRLTAAYTASKGGIAALTRQAAVEYGSSGIRINAVAPGSIDTPMGADLPPEAKNAVLRRIPLGRRGAADEVAQVAVFLMSAAASYVSGQVISVDGGWSAKS